MNRQHARVYFGGKILGGGGYRKDLFHDERIMSSYGKVLEIGRGTSVAYEGPLVGSCDHGCGHIPYGSHGEHETTCGMNCWGAGIYNDNHEMTTDDIAVTHANAIRRADIFFGWLEDMTAFGTIAEAGFARASGTWVHLAGPAINNKELWFVRKFANSVDHVSSAAVINSLRRAVREFGMRHRGPGTEIPSLPKGSVIQCGGEPVFSNEWS